jgi:hypothetical protein
MTDVNDTVFTGLFKAAYQKCFGFALTAVLTETESRHFGNTIFEDTGLVIGAKSLKNYSLYILGGAETRHENPSVATLDTLARYVLNAPYTDEIHRKDKEAHYPYWFQYKNTFSNTPGTKTQKKPSPVWLIISLTIVAGTIIFFSAVLFETRPGGQFTENFHSLRQDSLTNKGWFLASEDTVWWNRRNEKPGMLSLFTLRGDNWPDSVNEPAIKNLLLRKINSDCFAAEIHLEDFIPKTNWQQAGILLMEDSNFSGITIRLSIAFNNFFGGFNKPGEIIIQAVSSGGRDVNRPEEIAHIPVFTIADGQEQLVNQNLRYSALRIEKNNNHFRFLYSISPVENFAFKEAFTKDLLIQPRYIGLFALKGFVNDANVEPVRFSFFSLTDLNCVK